MDVFFNHILISVFFKLVGPLYNLSYTCRNPSLGNTCDFVHTDFIYSFLSFPGDTWQSCNAVIQNTKKLLNTGIIGSTKCSPWYNNS